MTNLSSSKRIVSDAFERLTPEAAERIEWSQFAVGEYYSQTVAFYDKCAELYDYLYPDHLVYSRLLFKSLHPIFKQHGVQRILDASCGIGYDMSCLLSEGFDVDGVDVSDAMLRRASSRLSKKGFSAVSLKKADVRSLTTIIPSESYDMVLFRGNTFSNIKPVELPNVVEQLRCVVRPGGLLCLDYRNGQDLIANKRNTEFRGIGYNSDDRAFFISYYRLGHSDTIRSPYRVRAVVIRANYRFPVRVDRLEIQSHYVDPSLIDAALRGSGIVQLESPRLNTRGLPHIENVIAIRPK